MRVSLEELEALARQLPCRHCGAVPGQVCTSPSGQVPRFSHAPRRGALDRAYLLGRAEGYAEARRDMNPYWVSPSPSDDEASS